MTTTMEPVMRKPIAISVISFLVALSYILFQDWIEKNYGWSSHPLSIIACLVVTLDVFLWYLRPFLLDVVNTRLLEHWLTPDPKTAPTSVWMLMDSISGGFYILVGTLWFWVVGRTVSRIIARVLPTQETEPNNGDAPNPRSPSAHGFGGR